MASSSFMEEEGSLLFFRREMVRASAKKGNIVPPARFWRGEEEREDERWGRGW